MFDTISCPIFFVKLVVTDFIKEFYCIFIDLSNGCENQLIHVVGWILYHYLGSIHWMEQYFCEGLLPDRLIFVVAVVALRWESNILKDSWLTYGNRNKRVYLMTSELSWCHFWTRNNYCYYCHWFCSFKPSRRKVLICMAAKIFAPHTEIKHLPPGV